MFCLSLWCLVRSVNVESYLAPGSHAFFSPFRQCHHHNWEERAGLYASRAFVCFPWMRFFFPLTLPLGVGGWLWLVIVALPGPLSYCLLCNLYLYILLFYCMYFCTLTSPISILYLFYGMPSS